MELKMKITEKMLLDNFYTITNGLDCVSKINGEAIIWNYRNDDGEYDYVCDYCDATHITLEYTREGSIGIDEDNANHPSIEAIKKLIAETVGDEI